MEFSDWFDSWDQTYDAEVRRLCGIAWDTSRSQTALAEHDAALRALVKVFEEDAGIAKADAAMEHNKRLDAEADNAALRQELAACKDALIAKMRAIAFPNPPK